MAKKAKKAAEEGGEAAAEAPASGGKKKLVVVGAAVAVLALGGGGAFYFLKMRGGGHGEHDVAATASVKKPVAFLDVREMTVNLAPEPGQDRPRFLRFKVALELREQKLVAEVTPLVPRIEDAFQVFVRELRPSDLEGSAGVYRLREELLRRVNIAVHPTKVDAILFKDVVVQ